MRRPGVFLDLSGLSTVVSPDPAQSTERGFFSVAFAPDYATTGRLYAFYTAQADGALRVDEFRRGADPDHIDAATRRPVLEIPHDQRANHNGGQLQFGPDGMLYVGTGDGGAGNDPADNAQNLTQTQPAVVAASTAARCWGRSCASTRAAARRTRSRPATRSARRPPRCGRWACATPTGSPSTAPRATSSSGDVGQDRYEEIDLAPASAGGGRATNFGWDLFEGLHTATGAAVGTPAPAGFAFPVVEHAHTAGWCSITGGYVVRDPALPDLAGQYVYGDYCLGRVWAARLGPGGATDVRQLALPAVPGMSSFGEDACGRVYVASLNGPVQRLADGGECACGARAGPGRRAAPAAGRPAPARTAARRSLSVSAAARQRVLRTAVLRIRVRCDEACSVRASGRVRIARTRARAAADRPLLVRAARARLSAGARTTLRLRLARSTRARIARALRRPRRTATASVTVRATDAAGNTRTRTVRVRIVRR